MAVKKKKNGIGYVIFLAVFSIAVLFAAYKVLGYIWVLAEEYEASRSATVIENYIEELRDDLESAVVNAVSTMEHPVQTDEECAEVAQEMLKNGISYRRHSSADGGRSITYALLCDNGMFGQVEIHKDESLIPEDFKTLDDIKLFKNEKLLSKSAILQGVLSVQAWFTREELTPWAVGETEFFFDGLYSSVRVTVPETYSVTLNGHILGEQFIVEDGIRYDVLEDYYEFYSGIPEKVTYSFDKIIGKLEPVIYDDEGNVVTIDPAADDSQFIKPCSEEEMATLTDFCDRFLQNYVGYTSGVYRNEYSYGYERIRPYVKSGSDIDLRLIAAQDGIQYAHSPATVSSTWVSDAIRLTEGVYLVDTGYHAGAQTPRGYEEADVEMRLIITEDNGDLRVVKENR